MDINVMERRAELQAYKETLSVALARTDFYEYVKYTNRGYIPNKFGESICQQVQQFVFDPTNYNFPQIMIIMAPPQHGKSTNITESFPAFYLGKLPDNKVIGLSYGDELARRFGASNLSKVYQFGQGLFGQALDRDKPATSLEFHIKGHSGEYISRGLTSGVTGLPGDLIIIDDPVKNREEADSEKERNKNWEGYLSNVRTRISANGKIIVILTRWHEDDLAGRIEAVGNTMGNVKVIHYECECETPETDPLGRSIGDPLSPELGKNKIWLDKTKQEYMADPSEGGRRTWEALFQGRPKALEGNIVQAAWLKFWKPAGMKLPPVKIQVQNGEFVEIMAEDIPDKFDNEIQAWDCSFKDKKTSDYVCGGVWKRRMANYYLCDAFHKVASFTDTIAAIEEMHRKHPKAFAKYIEDKANGSAVISSLKSKISGIIPIEATDDKIARLHAVTPAFQSGNVYFPHPMLCEWVMSQNSGLIPELMTFPNSKNDDWVDMISHALNKLMYETRDTQAPVVPKGTWAYQQLKEKGFSDLEIGRAYRNGDIKLYLIPEKFKKWERKQ